ncbi:hypothetical protein E5676_scaffold788G00090 [Cucumis melo var. makuwa]|uniref:Uncharacterized protein n=1 Tax=Cucumis melo var. makuwa TaxID=1194695 RepID=A0A5D3E777_CUCMM|nr:hypothetical protein E5676_scaffold788G00090 [Cucumis melo var. makuwa]
MVRIGATKCTGQRPTKGKRRRASDEGQTTMGKRRWASDDEQLTMAGVGQENTYISMHNTDVGINDVGRTSFFRRCRSFVKKDLKPAENERELGDTPTEKRKRGRDFRILLPSTIWSSSSGHHLRLSFGLHFRTPPLTVGLSMCYSTCRRCWLPCHTTPVRRCRLPYLFVL